MSNYNPIEQKDELLEEMWNIICNAGGGDWKKESEEWQEATMRIREKYFALMQKITK